MRRKTRRALAALALSAVSALCPSGYVADSATDARVSAHFTSSARRYSVGIFIRTPCGERITW